MSSNKITLVTHFHSKPQQELRGYQWMLGEDTQLPIMGVRRALFAFVYVIAYVYTCMLFWCFFAAVYQK